MSAAVRVAGLFVPEYFLPSTPKLERLLFMHCELASSPILHIFR